MLIPQSQAAKLRNYQNGLFHREDIPKSDRRYALYLLLRPRLGWLKSEIKKLDIESDEAESEIYLMCCRLFDRFDPTKSSIVPYLTRHIPWESSRLLRVLSKEPDMPIGLTQSEEICYMQEEFYWTVPHILLEDRYIGNLFTKDEKYLMYVILESDIDELNQVAIAEKTKINRRTWISRMKDLQEVFKEEGLNAIA